MPQRRDQRCVSLRTLEIGARRELGSFTFTAEAIKKFAAQFDPQAFHLDEEAGRRSLFGGLAASGWHVGSVCMKLLVADGQRLREGGGRARREDRGLGTVAGLSRTALDQAGAGRRHHQLLERRSKPSERRRSVPNGASCRPATPAPISAASRCIRFWRPPSCRDGMRAPEPGGPSWLADRLSAQVPFTVLPNDFFANAF